MYFSVVISILHFPNSSLQRMDGVEHSSPTASKPSSAKRAMYDVIEGIFLLQYRAK